MSKITNHRAFQMETIHYSSLYPGSKLSKNVTVSELGQFMNLA